MSKREYVSLVGAACKAPAHTRHVGRDGARRSRDHALSPVSCTRHSPASAPAHACKPGNVGVGSSGRGQRRAARDASTRQSSIPTCPNRWSSTQSALVECGRGRRYPDAPRPSAVWRDAESPASAAARARSVSASLAAHGVKTANRVRAHASLASTGNATQSPARSSAVVLAKPTRRVCTHQVLVLRATRPALHILG